MKNPMDVGRLRRLTNLNYLSSNNCFIFWCNFTSSSIATNLVQLVWRWQIQTGITLNNTSVIINARVMKIIFFTVEQISAKSVP